jgi:hypothetical protein
MFKRRISLFPRSWHEIDALAVGDTPSPTRRDRQLVHCQSAGSQR